jgi:hypothetical protein
MGEGGGSSAVMFLYRIGGVGGGVVEQCGKVTLPHCSPTPDSFGPQMALAYVLAVIS